MTANAWMNTPQGLRSGDGVVVDGDPISAMFKPATGVLTAHLVIAAHVVTVFLRRGRIARGERPLRPTGDILDRVLGSIFAPTQALVGHWAGQVDAET